MKRYLILVVVLLTTLADAAEPLLKLPKLVTTDGKTFTGVSVMAKVPQGLKIVHDGGFITLRVEQIPADLAKQLGGFDLKAAAAAEEAAAKAKEDRSKMLAKETLMWKEEYSVFEPFSSALGKEEANVTDREHLEWLRESVRTIRQVCVPLWRSGKVHATTVHKWVECAANHEVIVGMPLELALIAWGKPSKINRSSYGNDQWVYSRSGAYLYFDKAGFLASWQD